MEFVAKVESLLKDYCSNKISQAALIDEHYVQLWEEISRFVTGGGKRMRPRLVLLAYDAYEGNNSEAILPIAAAWELLHSSLLVHDDIIDRDLVRHGLPNIAGRYRSIYGSLTSSDIAHYALSAALISGDLLLMGSHEMVDTASISSEQKLLVHAYIHKAIFTVAGGQLIDTDAVLYPVGKSNPHAVAMYKTANYSLQLPLECGAALAGAPKEELGKLRELGLHAGVAFQLRDDLLGIFGDSNMTGKSNRSDIVEKKRTALVEAALKRLPNAESARLTQLFAPDHEVNDTETEEILALITSSGAKESIEHMITEEANKAHAVADSLAISPEHKQAFATIITKLTNRTH